MSTKLKIIIIGSSVLISILLAIGVLAAINWSSKTLPSKGTINITTTPPPADYSYTFTPSMADFGTTSFPTGSPVSVTFDITVNNTGNQNISGFGISATSLPTWLTAAITQTPITAANSSMETITVSGTAPASPVTFNFLGPSVLSSVVFTITPN
jgi:hypothetical protein